MTTNKAQGVPIRGADRPGTNRPARTSQVETTQDLTNTHPFANPGLHDLRNGTKAETK